MGLYEVPLFVSLLGFGMGTMLANFHMYGIMLVLKSVFNMLVRNVSPRGSMCFRCLRFSLSGHCEFLFLLCFIVSWTLVVVSVMLYPCIVCVAVNGFVCLVSCVFDSVCEWFGDTISNVFGCGCYFVVEASIVLCICILFPMVQGCV